MKKQIVITLLATAFLATAGSAQARDWNRGHHNGHHNSHGYVRHQLQHSRIQHRRRDYHQYGNHHYSPYRYSGYYGYTRGHHDDDSGLKIVAGALILGSIIHASNHDRRRNVVYRSRPVASNRGNSYRVDTDGQCVEVTRNRQGEEVWTYVDSSYCY